MFEPENFEFEKNFEIGDFIAKCIFQASPGLRRRCFEVHVMNQGMCQCKLDDAYCFRVFVFPQLLIGGIMEFSSPAYHFLEASPIRRR